jgi:hypothetical protein
VSAWALREWAKQNNLFVDEPVPGDLFALLYPKKPGDTSIQGHAGIFTGHDFTDSENFINSVDGNVADAVRAGRRKIENDLKFIRLPGVGGGPRIVIEKTLMSIHNLGDR